MVFKGKKIDKLQYSVFFAINFEKNFQKVLNFFGDCDIIYKTSDVGQKRRQIRGRYGK